MRVVLWDEFDVAPDVEIAPRLWCAECRRRTLFTRDLDGYPVCRECIEELEESHV
ncbi:hypothetical protein F4827_002544 [Paraburkholderia bannensis]|uniref:Uncharacterized protein n=1 Tax=Paraburkholderia bannensis TaxID=765414 RepID=A0A7W9TWH3_9BURK|nr:MULTISPECIES: hypothetical protein [Paraburkholderia]MBB3257679.1 hypothetical protein [Paraburkholderia sp. WP4_3_2]MBB6102692.1 hypothetical protein [Paraburkholderia bannensis]